MCEKCNVRDRWSIMNAKVTNASKETVYYQDAYYNVMVTIPPGETKDLSVRVQYS